MMRRRNTLITLIVAELAGVLLLVLLYILFRSPLAPTSLPTSTQVAVAPSPTIQASQQYTVVEGDTLWGVAVAFHLSLDEIVAANPGINPDRVYPGDVINVPTPGTI